MYTEGYLPVVHSILVNRSRAVLQKLYLFSQLLQLFTSTTSPLATFISLYRLLPTMTGFKSPETLILVALASLAASQQVIGPAGVHLEPYDGLLAMW